ncbi:WbqC family protein [Candidatus Aciduliprofundum boonei]|uniref:WbqC-like family protein n=1 Tax=Aciduliprofundum boonei (strain DSM 19572 / T469) TaxID=439481 RepID=B5IDH3_ACIB4|nr:WbqC family protein [Candidatus Aciduliprofundum boonei]ADD08050.1 WbqC-like family protein [Aciduliprofundum boonei T469]EDY35426.1 WbqC-like protein family [Aciduliprofundum boonei T469]EDY35576.1 WbqC-like protein family [Aciduliprofundum boonei T469]HII55081.1 WbqC family protein [Candidatus Aciduliprofundum boonei]
MFDLDKIVAAHQPNYLPWIGYFHKILKSDVFIILDHVQFSRRGFINRNRVKGPKGAVWLTVPVRVHGTMRIMDVHIDNTKKWNKKHADTLKAFYAKAPYFEEVYPILREVYELRWESLAEFNIEIIMRIVNMLDINRKFIRSSTLELQGKKMDMIIELCKKVGATVYFSGKGAMRYQDPKVFEKNGIKLVYQEFEHPVYPQRFGDFVPNLSILDMLFNVGIKNTREILKNL